MCVGILLCGLTGSSGRSCESSISAAEQPDMSARSAYSLHLESLSGPCFTQTTGAKKHKRHRINGQDSLMPYVVSRCVILPSPCPINAHWCTFPPTHYLGGNQQGDGATIKMGHLDLISHMRPAGEEHLVLMLPRVSPMLGFTEGLRTRATLHVTYPKFNENIFSRSIRCLGASCHINRCAGADKI